MTTQDFPSSAAAFCSWAESEPKSPDEEVVTIIEHLTALCFYTYRLGPGKTGDAPDVSDVPEEQKREVLQRMSKMPFNHYFYFDIPYDFGEDIDYEEKGCIGMLSDDLMDIYIDVKRGLLIHEAGYPDEAIWHWRFHFSSHWGRHATEALHALHTYTVDHFLWV